MGLAIGQGLFLAKGSNMNPLALLHNEREEIANQCDTEMLELVLNKGTFHITFNYDWVDSIINAAMKSDQLGVLKWLKKRNFFEYPYFKRVLFIEAARGGNLGMITWAKDIAGFSFQDESHFINAAAESGNIELVKYLRSEDISWNESTFGAAVSSGNIAILQYLIENDCPHDDQRICANAVEIHDCEKALEVLHWLHNQNISWDENTCITSARIGNLKALKFARSKGCPWDKNCLIKAIKNHHYEVVEYCLQNRCSMGNSDICHYAMDYNNDHDQALRILKLLRKFSAPWGEHTCSMAASTGNFHALKWAVSNGCAINRQDCASDAAWHGKIEALKWIKAQGVVFNEKIATKAA
ncbi:hypothetical protein CTEN210_09801 [Chaetoceros tenuissimus]|uniref:Uncharacterized protein n=1 Tax=Chaetoceros tenuissimus TaxID=426638 RepID=A0AAD3CYI1_9STRA|nr:hypothetical protein CTEN210_09801 [Chaetoceros tenuissimus]